MIEIKHLNFSYNNEEILHDVNFTIKNDDYLLITGPNGIGKSTLVKCITGINKVKHNQIIIDQECITCFDKFSTIGYVPQVKNTEIELPITPYELFSLIISKNYSLTKLFPEDNNHDISKKEKIVKVAKLLNIEKFLYKNINDLSGGQKQRVYLAKSLLSNIHYLILDEPTTGLDNSSQKLLLDILNLLNSRGITIIVVTHDSESLFTSAKSAYNLETKEFKQLEKK